jgi:uncharacterized membrane protein
MDMHDQANPTVSTSKTPRLLPLDALRGLIMILMALDHASYFIAQKHPPGEHWGGLFPVYDDALSFITRFMTHPVAPGFVFLMGVGMALFAYSRRKRGWSEWAIIQHFLIRGALMIALQLTVVNLAWRTGPSPFPGMYIGVLVALGGGMILGSLFLRLKPGYLVAIALMLFVGMEFAHPDPSQWGQIFDQPLGLLFGYSGGDMDFWSNFPVLPWLELVIFGMAFGKYLILDSKKGLRWSLVIGVALLLLFYLVRVIDGFGNIRPRAGDSWIDFLNVVKYPPAMTFTLLTMGINLIFLGIFARTLTIAQGVLQPLTVIGQVPMFFYILHLYLYGRLGAWFEPSGTSISAMYPYWIMGVLILYPLCLWYGRFKQRQPANSLLRFL